MEFIYILYFWIRISIVKGGRRMMINDETKYSDLIDILCDVLVDYMYIGKDEEREEGSDIC